MTRFNRRRLLALGSLALVHQGSLSAETVKRPTAMSEVWARTELYFGTSKPAGQVTDEEFAAFIDYEVTPRFPDGLTLLTGYGQFRGSTGELIREKSHVLIILYPPQMADANKKLQEIREQYKTMFQQESVLRVDSVSFVSF
jgi:hypothetical protein